MIFATIPQLVVDLTAWFGLFAAIFGVIAAVNKTPLAKAFRWAARRLVVEPLESWLEKTATGPVKAEIKKVEEKVDATDHYVRYHLGPNSSEPPLYTKIDTLEAASTEQRKLNQRFHDANLYVRVEELESHAGGSTLAVGDASPDES